MNLKPNKPTRNQQKQQAKFLDSLINPSNRINLEHFLFQIQNLTSKNQYHFFNSDRLKNSCDLNDLIHPLNSIYTDSNLLSELRDYQLELATPHGSLHALHHSIESHESFPSSSQLTTDIPSDPHSDIPVHSKSIHHNDHHLLPDYLDPTLFSSKSSINTYSKTSSTSHESNYSKHKRIRKKVLGPPPSILHKPKPIQDLVTRLSNTGLKLLQPDFDGMWYVRSVGRSDWNTSTQPMNSNLPITESSEINSENLPLIITITFHPFSKTSVNNEDIQETKSIAPRKQTIHILSNQKLSDLRDVVVCPADKIPICYDLDGTQWGDLRWISGSVFMIENVLFSDIRNLSDDQINPKSKKLDYALLLQQLLPNLIEKDKINNLITREDGSDTHSHSDDDNVVHDHHEKVNQMKKKTENKKIQISSLSMDQVRFDQLTLRINEPYWMLHQGNCEHLFTVDEIRAMHPTDPSPNSSTTLPKNSNNDEKESSETSINHTHEETTNHIMISTSKVINTNPYPITSFLSRISSPKCRVCDRDPAQLVTISDELCSESPCFICFTCFKFLHAHEDIFEPNESVNANPNHPLDHKKIRWGKVDGREWWALPLLESS